MSIFNYKGIEVEVFNNGGKEDVNYIQNDTPSPVKHISGDRIQFQIGSVKYIYSVNGISLNQVTASNEVLVDLILINSSNNTVILSKSFNFSVSKEIFYGMSQLQSLNDSTILKTMFMHFLNGVLSRVPELGGDIQGWGLEHFNNDGTVSQPLYTYEKDAVLTIKPVDVSVNWKLIVDGEEWFESKEVEVSETTTDPETGEEVTTTTIETELVKSLVVSGLSTGFHQFTYQILDEEGVVVVGEQTRNILV
jgi:hypothetical protein